MPSPDNPKYPEIEVQLTGQDSNTLSLAAIVGRALRAGGHPEAENELVHKVFDAGSPDEALSIMMSYVSVS